MPFQLHPELIARSFERLRPIVPEGKKTGERTSALFYFLSANATSKEIGSNLIDLDPDSSRGEVNRGKIALQFAKLSLLSNTHTGVIRHVSELGSVGVGGTDPVKRISSNFLTVSLKKATLSREPDGYPKRPPAPLLSMGGVATGHKWGIQKHANWQTNLPKFLTELRTNTPFTDLAVFVCRNERFPKCPDTLEEGLVVSLGEKFTKSLADWWVGRIGLESKLFQSPGDAFTDKLHRPLAGIGERRPSASQSVDELSKRITYLERLLDEAGIDYQ